MRYVKYFLAALAAIAGVLLLVAWMLPSQWTVARSARIQAPPEEIFPYINSLKKWTEWAIWYEREPDLKAVYAGPDAGVGAISSWSGKDGDGQMRVIASQLNEWVRYKLEFNNGEFVMIGEIRLQPETSGATAVTWTTGGDLGSNLIAKLFMLFMQDRIGEDYELGLAKLRKLLEKNR